MVEPLHDGFANENVAIEKGLKHTRGERAIVSAIYRYEICAGR